MSWASDFLGEYVAAFNASVASGDFSPVLARFADSAVLRFENVPPDSSTLEYAGRRAYTAAYADSPPGDQIDLTGEPAADGEHLVGTFAWRESGGSGVLDLIVTGGLIQSMTIIFG
jgi:steroid Delta-isomerase